MMPDIHKMRFWVLQKEAEYLNKRDNIAIHNTEHNVYRYKQADERN